MKPTLNLPRVTSCAFDECAFNLKRHCQARAIVMGRGEECACGTYIAYLPRSTPRPAVTVVGACKISECLYNSDLICTAGEVSVGPGTRKAQCLAFSPRPGSRRLTTATPS